MRRHSAKYRSVYINPEQQGETNLHGNTPQLDTELNGISGPWDFECITKRKHKSSNREPFYKTDNTAEVNVTQRWNQPLDAIVHLDQTATISLFLESKQEDEFILDTVAAKQYKEKESQENWADNHEKMEP